MPKRVVKQLKKRWKWMSAMDIGPATPCGDILDGMVAAGAPVDAVRPGVAAALEACVAGKYDGSAGQLLASLFGFPRVSDYQPLLPFSPVFIQIRELIDAGALSAVEALPVLSAQAERETWLCGFENSERLIPPRWLELLPICSTEELDRKSYIDMLISSRSLP
jgi:hypothetical protein